MANYGKFKIKYTSMECKVGSNELGAEEPYCYLFSAHWQNRTTPWIKISRVSYTGVYTGSKGGANDPSDDIYMYGSSSDYWNITSLTKTLFLLQAMEHDEGYKGKYSLDIILRVMEKKLAALIKVGATRSTIISNMKKQFSIVTSDLAKMESKYVSQEFIDHLDLVAETFFAKPSTAYEYLGLKATGATLSWYNDWRIDDKIGGVQKLTLYATTLQSIVSQGKIRKYITCDGTSTDDGKYVFKFSIYGIAN